MRRLTDSVRDEMPIADLQPHGRSAGSRLSENQ
jgi:hypothetical protein